MFTPRCRAEHKRPDSRNRQLVDTAGNRANVVVPAAGPDRKVVTPGEFGLALNIGGDHAIEKMVLRVCGRNACDR